MKLVDRATQTFSYGRFSESRLSGKVVLEPWFTPEGRRRLAETPYAEPFYRMAHHFQPQSGPVLCGVASAVIVLNALSLPGDAAPEQPTLAIQIPDNQGSIAFKTYAQSTFLEGPTEAIKRRRVVEYLEKHDDGEYRPGLGLSDLGKLIECRGAKAPTVFAGESNVEAFRSLVMDSGKRGSPLLILHFRADVMGGIPRGHISPVGAYHPGTDSVLVMDVATHKGPWYWAPVPDLFEAMRETYDTQPKGGGWAAVTYTRSG